MSGGTHVRFASFLVLIALVVPIVSAVNAPQATTISIAGPALVGSGAVAKFDGVVAIGPASGVVSGAGGVPGQTVSMFENGALIGTHTTGARGEWTFSVVLTGRGPHVFFARTDQDGPLEARSRDVIVNVAVPPTEPTSFAATLLAGANVTLTWGPPTDVGGSPVQAYRIERRDGPNWTLVSNVGGSARSTLAQVTQDGAYTYRARASSIAGIGNASQTQLDIDLRPPSAPQGVVALAQTDARIVDLSWAAPATNGSGPLASFRVDRSLDGVEWVTRGTFPASRRTFSDSVPADATYRYAVLASNLYETSEPGLTDVLVDMLPPSEPLGLSVQQVPTRREVSVQWEAPQFQGSGGMTGYHVERLLAGSVWEEVSATNVSTHSVLDAVPADGEYAYRVRATSLFETGPASAPAGLSVDVLPPAAPTGVSATQRLQQWTVDIAWSEPPDVGAGPIDHYIVERNDGSGWVTRGNVGAAGRLYADVVDVDGVYDYRVSAATLYKVGPGGQPSSAVDFKVPDRIDHEIWGVYACDGDICSRVDGGGTAAGQSVFVIFQGFVTIDEGAPPNLTRVDTFTNMTYSCGSGCTQTVYGGRAVYTDASGYYQGHVFLGKGTGPCVIVSITSSAHTQGVASSLQRFAFRMC